MSIYISPDINILLVKHKKKEAETLIINSNYYFIKYTLNKNITFQYNKGCRILNVYVTDKSVWRGLSNLVSTICKLKYEVSNYTFKKIKFIGKSYKIKKCLNYFSLEFNKAHIELLIWSGYFIKKLKKSTILLKGVSPTLIKGVANSIVNVKKINPFTLRGLRLDRCILKKKQGKKTS